MRNLLKYIGGGAAVILIAVSCIKNDIPYPVVKGDILTFSVKGELEPAKISSVNQTVTLKLADTVDISKVEISQISVSEEGHIKLNVGDLIDLTEVKKCTVSTYSDYVWTIVAEQTIDRYFEIDGEVSPAVIDAENKIVLAYIPEAVSKTDINVKRIQLGSSKSKIYPSIAGVVDFSNPITVVVNDFGKNEEWKIVVQQIKSNVSSTSVDAWATFATFVGSYSQSSSLSPSFKYRVKSSTDWQVVPSGDIQKNGSAISAKVVGLLPATEYVMCATLGEETGREISFTTEAAPTIENLSFDSWHETSKGWYPNESGGNSYWGSGNEGVTMSPVNKTSNTTPVDDAVAGKAARLETISVPLVKLAAGNIFTGKYKTNLGDPIKSVTFGRPYTGRPTRLEGYYKYSPKTIDVAKSPYEAKAGTMDRCHIYIRLENWGSAEERPAEPEIIAYGELQSDESVASYKKFSIDISYTVKNKKPTHVVLVATSSYLGDYFTGGVGSTLFVDEFELKFD